MTYLASVVRVFCVVLLFTCSTGFPSQAESMYPYLLRMKYVATNASGGSSHCIVVFPDGKFHMEHSDAFDAAIQVFEDSLPQDSLNTLNTILQADQLRALPNTTQPQASAMGWMIWATIPRRESLQKLVFADLRGSPERPEKKFPHAMRPLLTWFESAMNDVKRRKVPATTHGKHTECGFSRD